MVISNQYCLILTSTNINQLYQHQLVTSCHRRRSPLGALHLLCLPWCQGRQGLVAYGLEVGLCGDWWGWCASTCRDRLVDRLMIQVRDYLWWHRLVISLMAYSYLLSLVDDHDIRIIYDDIGWYCAWFCYMRIAVHKEWQGLHCLGRRRSVGINFGSWLIAHTGGSSTQESLPKVWVPTITDCLEGRGSEPSTHHSKRESSH